MKKVRLTIWVLRARTKPKSVLLGFNAKAIAPLPDPLETLLTSHLGPLLVQQPFTVCRYLHFRIVKQIPTRGSFSMLPTVTLHPLSSQSSQR